jgi:GNAT superfamily N-acetyltransferase
MWALPVRSDLSSAASPDPTYSKPICVPARPHGLANHRRGKGGHPVADTNGLTIEVTDALGHQEADAISSGLDAFNVEATGVSDLRPLAVVVKDSSSGRILGGATGRTSLGLLFVDIFFLPRSLRGRGLGSHILQLMEDEGRKRGCRAAVLYTISFQAPDFYRRHGWHSFGEIPCEPPGTSRIFMTKAL